MIKDFKKFPYVCDKHNNIWKYTDDGHFLKVSPWNNGEDRRINRFEIEKLIEEGKLTQYTAKSQLFEKLNKRWDDVTSSWTYNGDTFEVFTLGSDGRDFYKAPLHKFSHTYTLQNGKTVEYFSEYRIVFFNGNIYWATPYHYWPQVQLYHFVSENEEPLTHLNTYFRWVKGYHLRPIWSTNKQEYI